MKNTLQFLKELELNNERDWFNNNKSRFLEAESELKSLVQQIEQGISRTDHLESGATKIFRIYRDVRFSNNKVPYNIHRSVSFKRATEALRGGYYLRVQRGNSCIVGGFFGPEPKDLLHIRKQIQQDPEPLRAILELKDYKTYFTGMTGEKVKSSPKGFDKEDPAIDLLRHKEFMLFHGFTDAEILKPDFAERAVEGYLKMRPFLDYMSEILTTDLNGVSLL